MHSIYVCNLDKYSQDAGAPVAIDIEDQATAETLVRSLAGSYPFHGRLTATSAYWFQAREGRCAIWCEPQPTARPSLRERVLALLQPARSPFARPA